MLRASTVRIPTEDTSEQSTMKDPYADDVRKASVGLLQRIAGTFVFVARPTCVRMSSPDLLETNAGSMNENMLDTHA